MKQSAALEALYTDRAKRNDLILTIKEMIKEAKGRGMHKSAAVWVKKIKEIEIYLSNYDDY